MIKLAVLWFDRKQGFFSSPKPFTSVALTESKGITR